MKKKIALMKKEKLKKGWRFAMGRVYSKDSLVGSERLDELHDEHQEWVSDGYDMTKAYMGRLEHMIE